MEFYVLSRKQNPMSAIHDNAKLVQQPTRRSLRRTETRRRPTILVVEDHDDTREMLHMMLEMWGCRVVEACNGLEAVETAAKDRPELILMDGSLPFLDGLAATRRIRENGFPEIKILALDGWGTPSYHADALAAGCDDTITKPLDFDLLHTYLDPFFDTSAQGAKANSLRVAR